MRYLYFISFVVLLIAEVLINKFNLLVIYDYIQDLLLLAVTILLSKELFFKSKRETDPLNTSKLETELLAKENKLLQQKIQTLETALEKNI